MNKGTLAAVAVFGLLLAGVLVTSREKPERGITRISFADVDHDTITRVVTSGKHAVELKKVGERWKLDDGKRADAAAVRRLLEAIPRIQSADVVTRNAERFSELGVDEENGLVVTAFAGDEEVARFTVGNAARGGSHLLVDDAVYAVRGVYASVFARSESGWLEKKLFDATTEDVNKAEVRLKEGTAYALVKQDDGWVLNDPSILPEGFRFDENAARRLVHAAINVRAKDVLDEDPGLETTGLGDEADTIVLSEAGGGTHRLRLGGAGDDGVVYAKADGWEEVVTLHEHTAGQLRKAVEDLRDLGLMDFGVDEVSRLELRDGDRQLSFTKDDGTWSVDKATEDMPEDFVLDEAKVRGRLRALKAARAIALAEEPKEDTLGEPSASATAVLTDGESVTLAFGSETTHDEREGLLARGNADDRVYVVAKATRDALLRGIESFKQTEQPPGLGNIDPSSLSNLPPEVRQALEKKIEEEKRKREIMEALKTRAQNNP